MRNSHDLQKPLPDVKSAGDDAKLPAPTSHGTVVHHHTHQGERHHHVHQETHQHVHHGAQHVHQETHQPGNPSPQERDARYSQDKVPIKKRPHG